MPEHAIAFDDQGRVVVDGVGTFARRGTAMRRRAADALVDAGAPVVLDWYGGGVLVGLTGPDATSTWVDVRLPGRGGVEWTAGSWVDDNGRELLYLTGSC